MSCLLKAGGLRVPPPCCCTDHQGKCIGVNLIHKSAKPLKEECVCELGEWERVCVSMTFHIVGREVACTVQYSFSGVHYGCLSPFFIRWLFYYHGRYLIAIHALPVQFIISPFKVISDISLISLTIAECFYCVASVSWVSEIDACVIFLFICTWSVLFFCFLCEVKWKMYIMFHAEEVLEICVCVPFISTHPLHHGPGKSPKYIFFKVSLK